MCNASAQWNMIKIHREGCPRAQAGRSDWLPPLVLQRALKPALKPRSAAQFPIDLSQLTPAVGLAIVTKVRIRFRVVRASYPGEDQREEVACWRLEGMMSLLPRCRGTQPHGQPSFARLQRGQRICRSTLPAVRSPVFHTATLNTVDSNWDPVYSWSNKSLVKMGREPSV